LNLVLAVDHRFALSNPTLLSSLSKKSFSSVSWPNLAWSTFKTTGGRLPADFPKTSAARSLSCHVHSVIWFGCTSKRCANSASVLSPAIAAKATLALNSAERCRLALFVILCSLINSA
jgi:hypothetical protein